MAARPLHPRATGGDATVREIMPWHVVEQRLAARASGVDLRAAPSPGAPPREPEVASEPPPSGVRMSSARAVPGGGAAPLSFRVYTLEELDRRSRESSSSVSGTSPVPWSTPWIAAGHALVALAKATRGWITTPKAWRPTAAAALSPSADELAEHLRVGLMRVDWRRVVVGSVIAVGTAMALLFAVLTVAELTDDLKTATPGRTLRTASGMSIEAPSIDEPTEAWQAEPVGEVIEVEPAPAIELTDEAPVEAEPAPTKARRTTKAEVFNP